MEGPGVWNARLLGLAERDLTDRGSNKSHPQAPHLQYSEEVHFFLAVYGALSSGH